MNADVKNNIVPVCFKVNQSANQLLFRTLQKPKGTQSASQKPPCTNPKQRISTAVLSTEAERLICKIVDVLKM